MNFNKLRIYTTAVEIVKQADSIKAVFQELTEKEWNNYTDQNGNNPILKDSISQVKRQLVKRYAIEMIKQFQGFIGLDLITLTIDEPEKLWKLDNVIRTLSDSGIVDHEHLFSSLLVSIYGVSGHIVKFALIHNRTRKDVYDILTKLYGCEYYDDTEHLEPSVEYFEALLQGYIETPEAEYLPITNVL